MNLALHGTEQRGATGTSNGDSDQLPSFQERSGAAAASVPGFPLRMKMDAQALDDGVILHHQFQQHLKRL